MAKGIIYTKVTFCSTRLQVLMKQMQKCIQDSLTVDGKAQ